MNLADVSSLHEKVKLVFEDDSHAVEANINGINAHAEAHAKCAGISDTVKVDITDFSITAALQIGSNFNDELQGYTPAVSLTEWDANLDAIKLNGINKMTCDGGNFST